MTTFIINHPCRFTGYLIALSLRIKYSSRFIRIYIMESPMASPNSMPLPWCGVSTISNARLIHKQFLHEEIIGKALAEVLIFVASVQIRGSGQSLTSPDLPRHRSHFSGTVGQFAHHVALLYHPDIVVAALRRALLALAGVTFLSQLHDLSLLTTVNDDVTCAVVFASGESNNKRVDMALAALAVISSATMANMPIAPVLWMPLFRGHTQMFDAIFSNTVTRTGRNAIRVDIFTINMNAAENAFASAHDVSHAVRAADHVLATVEHVAELSVGPAKL